MACKWSLFYRNRKCGSQISNKLPKVTKLEEGKAAIQNEMFECEPQPVLVSTDIENKKENQRNSVFPGTPDLSLTYKCQAQQPTQQFVILSS